MQTLAYGVFLANFNGTQLMDNVLMAVQPLLLRVASMQAKNLQKPRNKLLMVMAYSQLIGWRMMYILEIRGL